MTPVTTIAPEDQRLERTLRESVARGVISEAQARTIADVATTVPGEPAPAPTAAARSGRLRAFAAEAVGYVGGALALVAGIVLAQELWPDLQPWARVTLLAVVTVGLFAGGLFAGRPGRSAGTGALHRLRTVLWVMSPISLAGTVAVAGVEFTELEGPQVGLAVATAVAVYGTVLWRVSTTGPQQLVTFGGVLATAVTALLVVEQSLGEMAGLVAWAVGVAWVLLAWSRWIRPRQVGIAAGAVVALMAPSTAGGFGMDWPLWLGLATAATMITLSIPAREPFLLGLGVFGIVNYVPQIIFRYFGDTLGAPVALLLTGIVLVAAAFIVARARPAHRGASRA